MVTAHGIKPTKKLTEAILNFLTPTNITGIRSWFGLVNQVSFAFSQAEIMAPFRELLRTKDRKFYWDTTLDKFIKESKLNIVQKIKRGSRLLRWVEQLVSQWILVRLALDTSYFKNTVSAQQIPVLTIVIATGK